MVERALSQHSPDESDQQLLAAIVARDEKALEAFYQRHAPLVLALCRRIVGNRNDAEQVLLDVFYEFWQRAEKHDARRSSPRSYLMLIARSRSLDFVRQRGARIESGSGISTDRVNAQGNDRAGGNRDESRRVECTPLEQSIDAEQAVIVRDALASLEPELRDAVESAFYDGLTYVEVAERLGLPVGTLKTKMRKALGILRQRLRRHFDVAVISKTVEDDDAAAKSEPALVDDDL